MQAALSGVPLHGEPPFPTELARHSRHNVGMREAILSTTRYTNPEDDMSDTTVKDRPMTAQATQRRRFKGMMMCRFKGMMMYGMVAALVLQK